MNVSQHLGGDVHNVIKEENILGNIWHMSPDIISIIKEEPTGNESGDIQMVVKQEGTSVDSSDLNSIVREELGVQTIIKKESFLEQPYQECLGHEVCMLIVALVKLQHVKVYIEGLYIAFINVFIKSGSVAFIFKKTIEFFISRAHNNGSAYRYSNLK